MERTVSNQFVLNAPYIKLIVGDAKLNRESLKQTVQVLHLISLQVAVKSLLSKHKKRLLQILYRYCTWKKASNTPFRNYHRLALDYLLFAVRFQDIYLP